MFRQKYLDYAELSAQLSAWSKEYPDIVRLTVSLFPDTSHFSDKAIDIPCTSRFDEIEMTLPSHFAMLFTSPI